SRPVEDGYPDLIELRGCPARIDADEVPLNEAGHSIRVNSPRSKRLAVLDRILGETREGKSADHRAVRVEHNHPAGPRVAVSQAAVDLNQDTCVVAIRQRIRTRSGLRVAVNGYRHVDDVRQRRQIKSRQRVLWQRLDREDARDRIAI